MPLTQEQITHIASLARIALSPEDADRYRTQLDGILAYVDQIQKVVTGDRAPKNTVITAATAAREDAVTVPSGASVRETLLSASIMRNGEYLKVPGVFENN